MGYRWKKSEKTKEPENKDKAYEYAVFLLSLKLRTIAEVLTKMQSRGYTQEVITHVIEQLKDQRYLDDDRYAEIFLENLKTYKNFGYYGIKKKMMDKKLPKALIESTLKAGLGLIDEVKIARRFLQKEGFEGKKPNAEEDGEVQYKTFVDSPDNKKTQKLVQKLKARGFRGEVVLKVLF